MQRRHDLFLFVRLGNLEGIEMLIQRGANVSSANQVGYTALHFAAEYGMKFI